MWTRLPCSVCDQGQLKALPARYVARRGLDVVRPLMYIAEEDIAAFAAERRFPILPCNLCGSQPDGSPGQRGRRHARSRASGFRDDIHPSHSFPIHTSDLHLSSSRHARDDRATPSWFGAGQMKMLLAALDGVGDGMARRNMLTALTDIRPTHLLDRCVALFERRSPPKLRGSALDGVCDVPHPNASNSHLSHTLRVPMRGVTPHPVLGA